MQIVGENKKKIKPVIAIDGPSGSGKGTMARMLAARFYLRHIDTGLIYRKIAKEIIKNEAFFDISGISSLNIDNIALAKDKSLRSEQIGEKASEIAKNQNIRDAATKLIRSLAENIGDNYSGSVVDGRDIGTVVFPDAILKIYLTASAKIRAKRRLKFVNRVFDHNKIAPVAFEEIYNAIIERDRRDTSRSIAPLSMDGSYMVIDTSNETVKQSFEKIASVVKNALH